MITRLAEYISDCPYFEGREIKINYLDKEIGSVSLEATGNRKVVRSYADGGRLISEVFVLALREAFDMGDFENICITEKCKGIETWLESKAGDEDFFGEKEEKALSFLKILKPFHLVRTEGNFAKYEAEIETGYLKI